MTSPLHLLAGLISDAPVEVPRLLFVLAALSIVAGIALLVRVDGRPLLFAAVKRDRQET